MYNQSIIRYKLILNSYSKIIVITKMSAASIGLKIIIGWGLLINIIIVSLYTFSNYHI
jgi:hypothetical protein